MSTPRCWESEYGVAASEVRADVKRYVDNMVHSELESLGLLMRVVLREAAGGFGAAARGLGWDVTFPLARACFL